MNFILALAGSYLLGSFPTAYLLVKWAKGVDIRTVGSGNVGATNAGRAAGKGVSAAVFVIDCLKGALPVWLAAAVIPAPAEADLACGLAAIVGHNFPVFLGFRGGKGVATTIGVLLAAMPVVSFIVIATWTGVFFASHYVSVASIAAAAMLPAAQVLLRFPLREVILGALVAALIVARHQSNIKRLVRGEEPRSGSGR